MTEPIPGYDHWKLSSPYEGPYHPEEEEEMPPEPLQDPLPEFTAEDLVARLRKAREKRDRIFENAETTCRNVKKSAREAFDEEAHRCKGYAHWLGADWMEIRKAAFAQEEAEEEAAD